MPSNRKPPGMNRGPEIYDPEALKIEYSRSERKETAGFARGRRRPAGRRKISLRILLLDILLLCIIGGVIYPFMVEMNRKGDIGDSRCRLELRRTGDDVLVSLSLKTLQGGVGNQPTDITISVNGRISESFSDLTPPAGEERTLRYRLKGEQEKLKVEAFLENEDGRLRLNAVSSAVE